jgi:hypothetical protein
MPIIRGAGFLWRPLRQKAKNRCKSLICSGFFILASDFKSAFAAFHLQSLAMKSAH